MSDFADSALAYPRRWEKIPMAPWDQKASGRPAVDGFSRALGAFKRQDTFEMRTLAIIKTVGHEPNH
jgi:hypothetical protein